MPTNIFDYSTTAASNNLDVPDGAPDGWDRADVNEVVRQLMAHIAKFLRDDAPWIEVAKVEERGDGPVGTPNAIAVTYSNPETDTLRISSPANPGVDYKGFFKKDRRVKIVGSTTQYASVSADATSTGTSPKVTEVVLSIDGGADLTSAITAAMVNLQDENSGYALVSNLAEAKTEGNSSNLIKDPNFEDAVLTKMNLDKGGMGAWSIDDAQMRSGAACLTYDTAGQTQAAVARLNGSNSSTRVGHIPAEEGDRFFIHANVKHTSGVTPASDADKVQVGYEFRNLAGTVLVGQDVSATFLPTTSYTLVTHTTGAAPAGTVYAVPFIQLQGGGTASVVYNFDDVYGCAIAPNRSETPSVASATVLDLSGVAHHPSAGETLVNVTGKTRIASISPTYAGHRVTLKFPAPEIDTLTTITPGTPITVTANAGPKAADGDVVYITSITETSNTSALNGRFWVVSGLSGNDYDLTGTTLSGSPLSSADVGKASLCASLIRDVGDAAGKLNLVQDFHPNLNSTITLVCDGTAWHEVNRARPNLLTYFEPGSPTVIRPAFAVMDLEVGQEYIICTLDGGTVTINTVNKTSAEQGEMITIYCGDGTIIIGVGVDNIVGPAVSGGLTTGETCTMRYAGTWTIVAVSNTP